MSFRTFIMLCCMVNIGFLFSKIYQHNQIAQLKYHKQRLERTLANLKQDYNTSQARLYEKTKLALVNAHFTECEHMRPLTFVQIKELKGDPSSLLRSATEPRLDPSCTAAPAFARHRGRQRSSDDGLATVSA